jgi:hypothetical protein
MPNSVAHQGLTQQVKACLALSWNTRSAARSAFIDRLAAAVLLRLTRNSSLHAMMAWAHTHTLLVSIRKSLCRAMR